MTSITTLLVAASPASASWRTLERGDRGDDVQLVQQALTKIGIRTTVDGAFGSGTRRSVRKYEKRVGIRRDGRVSRGQARGLFKRAGMDPSVVDDDNESTFDSKATPRSAPVDGSASGVFPIQGDWKWGRGFGNGHEGVDVMADCGLPLVAPEAGEVVRNASQSSAGNYLIIRVASGEDLVFMHLESPSPLKKGASVTAGDALGTVGRTGNATACHLHFEIWTSPGWYEGGAARDPKPDLQSWAGSSS